MSSYRGHSFKTCSSSSIIGLCSPGSSKMSFKVGACLAAPIMITLIFCSVSSSLNVKSVSAHESIVLYMVQTPSFLLMNSKTSVFC